METSVLKRIKEESVSLDSLTGMSRLDCIHRCDFLRPQAHWTSWHPLSFGDTNFALKLTTLKILSKLICQNVFGAKVILTNKTVFFDGCRQNYVLSWQLTSCFLMISKNRGCPVHRSGIHKASGNFSQIVSSLHTSSSDVTGLGALTQSGPIKDYTKTLKLVNCLEKFRKWSSENTAKTSMKFIWNLWHLATKETWMVLVEREAKGKLTNRITLIPF